MQIAWQAEIGLAEIDERIADADRNLRELGLLIPELAIKGYSTAEIEGDLLLMTKALHGLRAQRRTIVETLDGDQPPPRIARPTARPRRRTATLATSAVVSTGGVSTWRSIYARLQAIVRGFETFRFQREQGTVNTAPMLAMYCLHSEGAPD